MGEYISTLGQNIGGIFGDLVSSIGTVIGDFLGTLSRVVPGGLPVVFVLGAIAILVGLAALRR